MANTFKVTNNKTRQQIEFNAKTNGDILNKLKQQMALKKIVFK